MADLGILQALGSSGGALSSTARKVLSEAGFLARFNTQEMLRYLQGWCPDHQGLLINLYEPIHAARQRGEIGEEPCGQLDK